MSKEPENLERIRQAAAKYRDTSNQELELIRIEPLADEDIVPFDLTEFAARASVRREAEKEFYRLLRDLYGWNPPQGISLD